MTTTVESTLTPAANGAATATTVEDFCFTDIPPVMDKLQWTQAARVMRKWINGASYVMPDAVKLGQVKASTLSPEKILDDVPFEWLFTGSSRVKPIIDELDEQLGSISDYNQLVGRLPNLMTQLSNGLLLLIKRLDQLGAVDLENMSLKNASFDFSDRSAIQLDESTQFNLRTVSTSKWDQATDDLDDVYGAMGGFAIKLAATKISTVVQKGGQSTIFIDEVGMYLRDTYDFNNKGGDQFLGYWNYDGVLSSKAASLAGVALSAKTLYWLGGKYFRVTNNSYNEWREKCGKGGDFLIFSTVRKLPVKIEIHIGKTDLEEFVERAQ